MEKNTRPQCSWFRGSIVFRGGLMWIFSSCREMKIFRPEGDTSTGSPTGTCPEALAEGSHSFEHLQRDPSLRSGYAAFGKTLWSGPLGRIFGISRQRLFILLLFGILQQAVKASDVVWLRLTPNFSYKDISIICSTSQFSTTLYFGAEVEGTQAIRAVLKDSTIESIADKIAFLSEDLSGIEFHQDKFDRLWLKNLTLSARLLVWVFRNAGDPFLSCKPTQPLKTVSPTHFVFTFNVDGLGESVLYSESQLGKFKGQRKDGAAYVATLQLQQKLFRRIPIFLSAPPAGPASPNRVKPAGAALSPGSESGVRRRSQR